MAITNGDILVYNGSQWVNQKSTAGPFDIDSPTFHVDSTNHRVGFGTTSPGCKLHLAGSFATGVTNVSTTPYTIAAGDSFLRVDISTRDITVNLPSAVGITGRRYGFKGVGSGYNIVLTPASGETIDGSSSKSIGGGVIVSDGSNWRSLT